MKRFLPLLLFPLLSGCQTQNENRVVLYCSVDSVFAKPLIADLEKQTGLQIEALFDTEATKTAGLTTKIRAEKNRPRADVFWSSALLQTLLLAEDGLLEPYNSPAARDLPSQFRGESWAGVGVRGRILVANEKPGDPVFGAATVRFDNLDYAGRVAAISNPQFGTASDWMTAFAVRDGVSQTLAQAKKWRASGVQILPGNGDVARLVADGTLRYGVTDTDDFLAQKPKAKPTFRVVKTEAKNVLVPGAVSIIRGGPNSANAKKLFDAIVSARNEAALIKQMPGVFSLRKMDNKANWQSGGADFSFLKTAPRDDYAKWPATWRKLREPLQKTLARP